MATDQELLNEIQAHLIETQDSGATWSSGLWTVAEVTEYLNNRQYDFLKRTGIVLKRGTLNTSPMVFRHALPQDWVATRRVVWRDPSSNYTELPRTDSWDADHFLPTWPQDTEAIPRGYTDGEVPTLEIETFPAASTAGELGLLYVALSTALGNSGVALTVPAEFAPAIKWGVIADMLKKTGRALDGGRSAYAEQRYEEGVLVAGIILGGWL